MGHLHDVKKEYRKLQERIDQGPAALPDHPSIMAALQMLYTPEEAELAARMPWQPISARRMARKMGTTVEAMEASLQRMADKGLVFDLVHPRTQKSAYVLAPSVVGFIEFTMMRVRDDIDQKQMAHHLHTYMFEDNAFAEGVFAKGDAQIGRALVHEDALKEEDFSEILDWERATRLIEASGGGALSLCYCRHKAQHLGESCDHPVEVCTSLSPSSDFVIRHGFGRKAEAAELLDVLAMARERGLVQVADNVQKRPMYICHCCGCHCGQLRAINSVGLAHAVRTSSRIAAVDARACTGCGRCVRRCPIGAISLVKGPPEHGRDGRITAQVDAEICLGCGVCFAACHKARALTLPQRAERVLTPESTLARIMLRAIERGTVHHMLFGTEDNFTMAFLHRFLGVVENLPPVRKAMLNQQVKSRFLERMLSEGKRRGADIV